MTFVENRILVLLCALALAAAGACASPSPSHSGQGTPPDGEVDAGTVAAPTPIVILMIGDGMGRAQLDAASEFRYGEAGQLFLQSLPIHGEIVTGSLSGITDSAAAATTMATGELTYNSYIGVDRDLHPLETLVEHARSHGLASGVVTTAYLSHATPAGFTAHHSTRNEPLAIADDQAGTSGADVMLGGGRRYFYPAGADSDRTDEGLLAPMEAKGYQVVTTRDELEAARASSQPKVLGLFADEHMDYVRDRSADSDQPELRDMSLAALDVLDARKTGFFLMIEGARIDMASHVNDLPRTIDETLAFDDAVRAVYEWAQGRDDVTLVVTADHECGGLEIVQPEPAQSLPQVTWRWGLHTNAHVDVFASGARAQVFDASVHDHRWIHASLLAALDAAPLVEPPRVLSPDGHLGDLRYEVADQEAESGFGVGINELDALHVDASPAGLAIGVEGLFEWDENTVVVLIDRDMGAGTGVGADAAPLSDHNGALDQVLSTVSLSGAMPDGFGAEFALASIGGMDPHREDLWDEAGLRGLVAPVGASHDFAWYGVAMNYGEGTRTRGPSLPAAGEGLEALVPWSVLYPDEGGAIPAGAEIGLAVFLVNKSGSFSSNQALPSFPPGTVNPGTAALALPGVARIQLDANGDAKVDAELVEELVTVE